MSPCDGGLNSCPGSRAKRFAASRSKSATDKPVSLASRSNSRRRCAGNLISYLVSFVMPTRYETCPGEQRPVVFAAGRGALTNILRSPQSIHKRLPVECGPAEPPSPQSLAVSPRPPKVSRLGSMVEGPADTPHPRQRGSISDESDIPHMCCVEAIGPVSFQQRSIGGTNWLQQPPRQLRSGQGFF
jgi:hypothetical protein